MKKNLTYIGIFVVLIFGLTIFTGCAGKKSVVTNSVAQEQEVAPAQKAAQTTDASKLSTTINPNDSTNQNDTTRGQSASVETTATSEASVSDINFDFDSSIIRPDAREILKINADYLIEK